MSKQKGLGKGLDALFGDLQEAELEKGAGTQLLPLQKLEPNPLQPRKNFDPEELDALADSIRQHGLIQPITVRRMPSGFYQIIAGERRWRACRQAGVEEVPVLILEADDRKAMELALIENLQRSDLDPIEEARGYQELMNQYGMTQEQAAQSVGKSRPAVANALRLLSLSEPVLALVAEGKLSAGHARAILAIKDANQQLALAQRVIALSLSVRQTETLAKRMAKPAEKKPQTPEVRVDYVAECEKELTRRLGRRVRIVSGKRKGRVELEYYGEDDLQALYEALQLVRGRSEKA